MLDYFAQLGAYSDWFGESQRIFWDSGHIATAHVGVKTVVFFKQQYRTYISR